MKFYNTLTRKKEEFIPLEEGKVKMYPIYFCGMMKGRIFFRKEKICSFCFKMFRKKKKKQKQKWRKKHEKYKGLC